MVAVVIRKELAQREKIRKRTIKHYDAGKILPGLVGGIHFHYLRSGMGDEKEERSDGLPKQGWRLGQ